MPFLTVYITHPDKDSAYRIGQLLVSKRLAACANIFPIESIYEWKGHLEQESEWVSLVKTRESLYEELRALVEKEHPYELPCIMAQKVFANEAYEHWIEEQTKEPVN